MVGPGEGWTGKGRTVQITRTDKGPVQLDRTEPLYELPQDSDDVVPRSPVPPPSDGSILGDQEGPEDR